MSKSSTPSKLKIRNTGTRRLIVGKTYDGEGHATNELVRLGSPDDQSKDIKPESRLSNITELEGERAKFLRNGTWGDLGKSLGLQFA